MLAAPRLTTRGPVIHGGMLARGSLVGVGLLALTAAGMPVALADDEGVDPPAPGADADVDGVGEPAPLVLEPDVPEIAAARVASSIEGYFGSGKTVGFQVEYDQSTAPSGLDLSGAVFTLTGAKGPYSCTTDVTGACSVTSTDQGGAVRPGTYQVAQTAHPMGLAAATGLGSVHICSWLEELTYTCDVESFGTVVNDSTFRSPVLGSVRDSVTGAPVEDAVYTLTGSGVTNAPTGDAAAAVPVGQEVQATSAADGSLTFAGWFLPGTYVLAPVGTVDGYLADVETTVLEIEPSTGELPASFDTRFLVPLEVPAPVDPVPPTTPAPTTPAPTSAPTTPAPTSAPTSAPVSAPAGDARPERVPPPAPVLPADPVVVEPSASSAPRTAAPSAAPVPTVAPLADGAGSPELTTASSDLPDKGLVMAVGGVFLIAILVGFGLVRRHARRRG